AEGVASGGGGRERRGRGGSPRRGGALGGWPFCVGVSSCVVAGDGESASGGGGAAGAGWGAAPGAADGPLRWGRPAAGHAVAVPGVRRRSAPSMGTTVVICARREVMRSPTLLTRSMPSGALAGRLLVMISGRQWL